VTRGRAHRAIVLAACALSLLLANTTHAQDEARVRAANQLRGYFDTKSKESVVDNRLDIDFGYRMVNAGIVFLSHTPSDFSALDPNEFGPEKEGIRKRWVTVAQGPFEMRLGDSYASFGSGMILRIVEDPAVEFDNVVDGLHFVANPGRWTIEAISGTNHLNLKSTDPRSTVKGISARFEPANGFLIGVNGAVIDQLPETVPGRDALVGVQGNGTVPGGIDFSGEYAILRKKTEQPDVANPGEGHGAYATARGSIGPLSLTVEGKDLLRFDHPFSIPPTAVRQHTSSLLNRGSHVPNIRLDDERGWQTEALFSLTSDIMLTGNWSRSEALHATLPASEGLGQIEATVLGGHGVGYIGQTKEMVPEGGDRVHFERITFGGDWLRPFGRGWSIETGFETQSTHKLDMLAADYQYPIEYRDQVASLSISRSPVHSWAATVEWSNEPTRDRDMWLWLEWNVRLGMLGQITFGGGQLREGQICSGGVCRNVKKFQGGRVEFLANF
jgi:hypothetical protein